MSRGSGTVVRGTVEYRNTAEPCEDMPRKSLDIRFTDYPVPQKRGLLRPFPAFRRGRVRAEPANGSRDESLVGFGATPQGLKTINICNFQGSLEPVFSAQFFHRLLDTTFIEFNLVQFVFACSPHKDNCPQWENNEYIITEIRKISRKFEKYFIF